jgi:hypothetical protein
VTLIAIYWPAAIVWGALMIREYVKGATRGTKTPLMSTVARVPPTLSSAAAATPQATLTTELARAERAANEAVLDQIRTRIDASAFCGECGRPRDSGSPTFCRFCGHRLTPPATS